MNLALVFRIGGVYVGLWALLAWFAPAAFLEMQFAAEATPVTSTMTQILAMCATTIALLNWFIPSWVTDNLNQAGIIAGCLWAAFQVMGIYHLMTDAVVADAAGYVGTAIGIVITALFFYKSKAV